MKSKIILQQPSQYSKVGTRKEIYLTRAGKKNNKVCFKIKKNAIFATIANARNLQPLLKQRGTYANKVTTRNIFKTAETPVCS
ncbi:MAG: hypothetical protein IJY98_05170 [Bacteroidaceae bacterium]|nr:hypothetical protein [Bacteroidaceae bacterium]